MLPAEKNLNYKTQEVEKNIRKLKHTEEPSRRIYATIH
jgi:hypothetical protein